MIKKLLLVLTSVLLTVALLEVVVRLFENRIEKLQIRGGWSGQLQTLSDPKLGKKVAPNAPGHDAHGFRNALALNRADIVTLGDSQTWGQNVEINETWPQVLGQLSGMTLYNMGMDGYGPVEYWTLTPDALQLSPKVVVVGLYFGNDLWDAYNAVYSRDAFADLREPSLEQRLKEDTVVSVANRTVREVNDLTESKLRNATPRFIRWTGEHTAIGRQLSKRGRWPGSTSAARNAALRKAIESFPAYGLAYDGEHTHTILTTSYRLAALNRNEPRIIEGLRITKLSLSRIQEMTSKAGVKLIVLLIPTKELVYADKLAPLGRIDSTYASLVQMETANRDEIKSYCLDHHIQTADALPALAVAVQRDQQIYPESADGHPNSAGYRLIAETVKASL